MTYFERVMMGAVVGRCELHLEGVAALIEAHSSANSLVGLYRFPSVP